MPDVKINQDYLKKIKLFQKYNKHYYDLNNPLVSDKEFDKLKLEILKLEKKYKHLNNINSPSNSVGFKASKVFKKVKHSVPMLSLGNAFDENDLINFEKKILNFLNEDKNFNIIYSAEPKIDGISASLIYKNGIGYQQGGIYSRMQMAGFTNDDMYASTVDVSEVFYMDGNDYVEGYVYQASEDGQACSVFGSTLATTLSGYLIARSNVSPQKDNNTA